uniref:Uncharacterized protein n=1 Tax=Avena sativa TaxID=4498 RepID=A0ACD5ZK51_AVESA
MGKESGREEQVATVRAVLGEETPEMDIIRALHMAGDDPTKAINILLDFHHKLLPPPPPPQVKPTTEPIPPPKTPAQSKPAAEKPRPNPATTGGGEHWWLVGSAEMAGLSTCKGRRIAAGEPVSFSIPNSAAAAASGKGRPARFALASCTSEIMRFSTLRQGEVGRIPNEWARCLLPLLKEGKIKIEGLCRSAPEILSIMDTVVLSVSVYIDSSMFGDQKQSLPKATEDSTFHPVPALFKVIGLSPFKKLECLTLVSGGSTLNAVHTWYDRSQAGCITTQHSSQISGEANGLGEISVQSHDAVKNLASPFSFSKLRKPKAPLIGGGNLIICPMTLLSQWKAEIEAHTEPNSVNIYVHYGQSRPKEANFIGQNEIVLTTYGVVASEFSTESSVEKGGLYSVHWFRVVLDEAHMIKSSKSLISQAAAALTADRRWCLTGTPIQNNLEDIYSLFRFLRVEPWRNWALWNKLVQKPFEEGDERGLKLVQSILKPVMLRRTKNSTDKEGRPILTLPPVNIEVKYCDLSETEKDFYEALFRRSKVKFDQFVEQGKVLHNYASILELLLRLRQCCDHPFLVMSRGDTQEFADLNKLAKRFLHNGNNAANGDSSSLPSKAYIEEVVQELQKGEGECPICLEAFEDAVLTPCAHRLCRECIFSSWQSPGGGLCPVCRKSMSKQDLITAPTNSRFQIDVEKNWVESSKISFLLQELESLRSSGAKSIVFSQWTAFLDLLQIPLSRHGFSFTRLDGTLNLQQREKVINEFSNDKSIMVLLMSLKAGGVGINLVAASNAFVMDPWWNPAVEEQAVMRIHRIGQMKSVSIKRFIVKGTVEERMEAVQARKQRMLSGALTDEEFRTSRLEELKMLFS